MPYYNRDPKRGHNFDNHPNGSGLGLKRSHFRIRVAGRMIEGTRTQLVPSHLSTFNTHASPAMGEEPQILFGTEKIFRDEHESISACFSAPNSQFAAEGHAAWPSDGKLNHRSKPQALKPQSAKPSTLKPLHPTPSDPQSICRILPDSRARA